jgi:hypothetical protein
MRMFFFCGCADVHANLLKRFPQKNIQKVNHFLARRRWPLKHTNIAGMMCSHIHNELCCFSL